jgi:hypothetical protein
VELFVPRTVNLGLNLNAKNEEHKRYQNENIALKLKLSVKRRVSLQIEKTGKITAKK